MSRGGRGMDKSWRGNEWGCRSRGVNLIYKCSNLATLNCLVKVLLS